MLRVIRLGVIVNLDTVTKATRLDERTLALMFSDGSAEIVSIELAEEIWHDLLVLAGEESEVTTMSDTQRNFVKNRPKPEYEKWPRTYGGT